MLDSGDADADSVVLDRVICCVESMLPRSVFRLLLPSSVSSALGGISFRLLGLLDGQGMLWDAVLSVVSAGWNEFP